MVLLVVGAVVVAFVMYLTIYYIITRYRHTVKSWLVLTAEAAVSMILGGFLVSNLIDLQWQYLLAFGLVLAGFSYCALALITVETWRLLRQGDSGSRIAQLQQKLQQFQDQADQLAWQIDNLRRKKKRLERENDEDLFLQRKLENEVQKWQSGGGMERIRGLRVEDWNSELVDMSMEEMHERHRELQSELDEGDDPRESLEVQATLTRLQILKRKMSEPNEELKTLEQSLEERERQRAKINAEIQKVDRAIRMERRERQEVGRDKFELK